MENTNIMLSANIQNYRKKCGLTQEELAEKLGVTFQAVSKWENAKSAPDIFFLPIMADLFGCHIDELFSREIMTEIHYDHCTELPWNDDDTIRVLLTRGKKILKAQEQNGCIEVSFPKTCNETTRQYFKVEVLGNIACDGSINGDVVCHGRIDCHEINGDVFCDGDIYAYEINHCNNLATNGKVRKKEEERPAVEYTQPIRTDKITVGSKCFDASYFGEIDMSSWSEYATKREYWRLENAEGQFACCEKTGDVLPYSNYPPIEIQKGQVFVIDYHTRKGTVDRLCYIADGTVWQNMLSTRRIIVNPENF